MLNLPKKPADQFVPKNNPEDEDIFVFWDRISKKMARTSISQFVAWLKTKFTYAEADHGHEIDDVNLLGNTLADHDLELGALRREVLELAQVVNKPPAAPTGVELVTEPTITLVDTLVKAGADGVFRWQGVEKPYPAQDLQAGAKPANGLFRLDAMYAKSDGTYGLVKGDTGTELVRKAIPAGTIWVRDIIWTSQGGTAETPQTINFNYASYTGKATPADTAVFLVQESTGTKYKWTLAQLVAWLSGKGIGGSVNSTDDIATEGLNNKWFTDARVYLAKATNYVIQGTTRAITQNDTLGMILGIFENRLNIHTAAIDANTTAIAGKADKSVDRSIASSGAVTLTLDRDAHVIMTGGQLTGNLSIILTGGVKGVVQILTFEGNGSATITISGATLEGSKVFAATLGAVNKLFIRAGQNKSGTLQYFYQWA